MYFFFFLVPTSSKFKMLNGQLHEMLTNHPICMLFRKFVCIKFEAKNIIYKNRKNLPRINRSDLTAANPKFVVKIIII